MRGAGSIDGVLAERIVVQGAGLARAPETLDLAEASTLPCAAVSEPPMIPPCEPPS